VTDCRPPLLSHMSSSSQPSYMLFAKKFMLNNDPLESVCSYVTFSTVILCVCNKRE
jgi:formylmethanofuran dehydrogenase subunit E-like metal-binding protein